MTQTKRVIPCYKEHDTSFISYYYTYDISKAILDLDPDLYLNFLSFVTLYIVYIETCMIPLSVALAKSYVSSSLSYELRHVYEDVMTPKLKIRLFFAFNCTIASSEIPLFCRCSIITQSGSLKIILFWIWGLFRITHHNYKPYLLLGCVTIAETCSRCLTVKKV